jgi:hypothetical protein
MLTWETLVLLALTGAGALLLLLQLLLLIRAVSARQLRPALRVLALFPPLSPFVAWRAGARLSVLLWAVVLMLYAALYALA